MLPQDTLKNVVDLSMSATDVSVSSANILSGVRDVQSAATSMASAIEELAASIGEIEKSAQRTATSAQQSSHLTRDGTNEVRQLGKMIGQTAGTFDVVASETQRLQHIVSGLSKVVELISSIAKQTNLLALNATIEAARAGEAGKGFTVVASEVKSLSRQTHDATATINQQIEQLNETFTKVLGGITNARSVMQTVEDKSQKVISDFDEINRNAGDISGQIDELSGIIGQQRAAIGLLSENMHIVKNKSDSNLKAVERLADQTDHNIQLIEKWRTELANEDITNKVVYLAKADHVLWKKRLLDIALGRSQTKASELADHTMCRLGKWYGSQRGTPMAMQAAFRELEEPHRRVHQHGIEAARHFESGRLDSGMEQYRLLEKASQEVLVCLDRLLASAA